MKFSDISVPEIYKSSADFRFFLRWFSESLHRIKYDTENMFDLYDPLRCPSKLLWMLADSMGFKYDDRLSTAFNRLVLVYFMSMIRNKGSKDGVTLAAEINLAQFKLQQLSSEYSTDSEFDNDKEDWMQDSYHDDILDDRLEDTSIPVNSVYVTPHTSKGYIEVVYFADRVPTDACIEYVRPLGMYMFQYAGVRYDSRTKISIDARLTNERDVGVSIGPTHVGHYRRDDYTRMQRLNEGTEPNTLRARAVNRNDVYDPTNYRGHVKTPNAPYGKTALSNDPRHPVYYRNSQIEGQPNDYVNPGYRALYSLQLCNNEHIIKSLIPKIFSIGYGPQDVEVSTYYPDNYLEVPDHPPYNLRYHRDAEMSITPNETGVADADPDVYTIEDDRTRGVTSPRPAVNPIMGTIGDAISLAEDEWKQGS